VPKHHPSTSNRKSRPSQPSDWLPVVKIGSPVSAGRVLRRISSSSFRFGHSQATRAAALRSTPTGMSRNSLAMVATVTRTIPRAVTKGRYDGVASRTIACGSPVMTSTSSVARQPTGRWSSLETRDEG
jgi:hypothetical protein